MGSHMFVNRAMNLLIYCSLQRNPLISFSVLGVGISRMALIFSGSTSMPPLPTIYPNNFPKVTPNVHFLGFNLNLNYLIISKNLSRVAR